MGKPLSAGVIEIPAQMLPRQLQRCHKVGNFGNDLLEASKYNAQRICGLQRTTDGSAATSRARLQGNQLRFQRNGHGTQRAST